MDVLCEGMKIFDFFFPRIWHLAAMPTRTQPDFFSAQISTARRFYLEMSPPAAAELAVLCGGCEHCAPDYEIHRADFPYYSIEFVAQGQGKLQLDDRQHSLAAGALYAYGPGIAQDIVNDPAGPLVKYFVDFTGKRASALLRDCGLPPGAIVQTSAPSEIMEIFDGLIRNGLRDTPFTQRIAAVQLEHLALKIGESAVTYGAASTAAFATYQRCRQHLEKHWLRLRSLEQIATECHVAPAHLCRLFRRFGHQSPYQCLLRFKMQHAAERLQTNNATIKQLADELGFSDPFHFSRVFKSVIGLSPSRFAQGKQRE
jgi:AraC-like DNA-binding protein